jgi:3',5'-cyclic AMP phosphodiesterase CpdA
MRIAVLSDMHGNLRALEAVTDDLRRQAPDLVVHAGDLALNGPRPAEVVPLAEPPDREDATAASTGRSGVLPREIVGR